MSCVGVALRRGRALSKPRALTRAGRGTHAQACLRVRPERSAAPLATAHHTFFPNRRYISCRTQRTAAFFAHPAASRSS